jgi:hypothetical protein
MCQRTYVYRDPFARGAYRRFTVGQARVALPERQYCAWCGMQPARLYGYAWEGDAQHPLRTYSGRYFCNFRCCTAYQQ